MFTDTLDTFAADEVQPLYSDGPASRYTPARQPIYHATGAMQPDAVRLIVLAARRHACVHHAALRPLDVAHAARDLNARRGEFILVTVYANTEEDDRVLVWSSLKLARGHRSRELTQEQADHSLALWGAYRHRHEVTLSRGAAAALDEVKAQAGALAAG